MLAICWQRGGNRCLRMRGIATTLPSVANDRQYVARTLPVRCHHRQWLPTLGNFFKLFKKVAKRRCRGHQHRERVANESPTVVTTPWKSSDKRSQRIDVKWRSSYNTMAMWRCSCISNLSLAILKAFQCCSPFKIRSYDTFGNFSLIF